MNEPTPSYDRWVSFHKANPEVLELFERFAQEARASRSCFGAKMIWERMRWFTQIETKGDPVKLNNNYFPLYARLLMLLKHEQFDGFFRTRRLKESISDADILKAVGGSLKPGETPSGGLS